MDLRAFTRFGIVESEYHRTTGDSEPTPSLFERLRDAARIPVYSLIRPIASGAASAGVTPNEISAIGCVLSITAAFGVLVDYWVAAGLLFLFASSLDMLDGELARQNGRESRFGALWDSVLDRIGESAMFIAVAFYFVNADNTTVLLITLVAWFSGLLTSYVRARAQSLGTDCRNGIITRPERVILLTLGLIFGILEVVLVVLAVGSLITVGQRVLVVRRSLFEQHPVP